MEGRGVDPTLTSAPQESPRAAAKLILVVEDDPDLAQLVAEVLESAGYRTAIAGNGVEALNQLRMSTHPDLILLDMMMPVMDGWKFREEQCKEPALASIPVVTVTADGDARGKAAAIQAAGYVTKPITIDSLLDAVERVCGLPEG
jgi:CheY-like chemotaxis protein